MNKRDVINYHEDVVKLGDALRDSIKRMVSKHGEGMVYPTIQHVMKTALSVVEPHHQITMIEYYKWSLMKKIDKGSEETNELINHDLNMDDQIPGTGEQ